MKFWWFDISQAEIETFARDLIERHGDGAREEAIRLADVGRRIGSSRNSAIYRRSARYLASEEMTGIGGAPKRETPMGKIANLFVEFGSPQSRQRA